MLRLTRLKAVYAYNMDARKFVAWLMAVPTCETNSAVPDKYNNQGNVATESADRNLTANGMAEVPQKNQVNLKSDNSSCLEKDANVGARSSENCKEGDVNPDDAAAYVAVKIKGRTNKRMKASVPSNTKPWEHVDHVEAESFLNAKIHDPIFHGVRDVAPNKAMYCLSFRLPEETCFSEEVLNSSPHSTDR